ncbi:MAG TPA: tetratricopeptide repeat protein [Casimicrobiaceae bacterium]|nr:tetratricopeptide repeat protein [Casimicrobiaceae bacterium]
MTAGERTGIFTFLFTDIEGSTRLWETDPDRMRHALARHDACARQSVESSGGTVVKMAGDGIHAAFADPLQAVIACVTLQLAIVDLEAADGLPIRVRCGINSGAAEMRDADYFGSQVNRAARIMSAAHGGQVLLSQSVASSVDGRLPADCALRDLGVVRLRDLAQPEHVFQVVHPRLRRDFPALRSLESTPNNLPQQTTSFVGRAREITEIAGFLTSAPLLTLCGLGGIGKSRLALQAAAAQTERFQDGVWLIELAPVSDGALVPQAVATVLGVKEEAGRPVAEALSRFVADRQLMLVLDNCEHVVEACARLAGDLLRAGPGLRILATSREPLRIAGEMSYSMSPLAVAESIDEANDLPTSDAARLFADRAAAAQPGFRVTRENARAVRAICERLAGIPLAIELAAARLRSMTVDMIDARLGDRFKLLTSGDPSALPRHQTLRASMDWSYDLLTESERSLLPRLAVFAGGFELEAAEFVCAGDDLDREAVVDALLHLVEKSLVALDAEGGRYRLLEIVRQYAIERDGRGAAFDRTRLRHIEFFATMAEAARAELFGPMQTKWLKTLDRELENILAAHRTYDEVDRESDLGWRLIYSLRNYWTSRGLLALGLRCIVHVLDRPAMQSRNSRRSIGMFSAGWLCSLMGRYVEAETFLREGLAIAREIGSEQRTAAVLQPLGMALLAQGKIDEATLHLEEAHKLARKIGDPRDIAAAMTQLGQLARVEGKLPRAQQFFDDTLATARELNDRESVAIALLNLAMVSIERGHFEQARSMLLEVVDVIRETGSIPLTQSLLDACTGLAASSGEWTSSARFSGSADACARRTAMRRDFADATFLEPRVASAREALGAVAFEASATGGHNTSAAASLEEAAAWLRRPLP